MEWVLGSASSRGKEMNNYYGQLRYARTIAGMSGLTVTQDATCTCPYATGSSIVVPIYNITWKESSWDHIQWWGMFIHECLHHLHPEDFDIIKKYEVNMKSPTGIVLNIVSDHNIERYNYGVYNGRDRLLRILYNTLLKDFTPNNNSETETKINALRIFDYYSRYTWMGLDWINYIIPPEIKDLVDKLNSLLDEYSRPREGGEPNWLLVTKIKKILDFPEEDSQNSDTQQKEQGSADGKVEVNFEDIINNLQLPNITPKTTGKNCKIHYKDKGGVVLSSFVPQQTITMSRDKLSSYRMNRVLYKAILATITNELPKKINRELQVVARVKNITGARQGKLHRKSVTKLATRTTNKVFVKKQERHILDTAITILIDTSGSMNGSPYVNAGASAIMLNECFSTLGVSTEIIGFTCNFTGVVNIVHKQFTDKLCRDKLADGFARSAQLMACNEDGESLLFAYDRLIQRKERNKIIVVLSDGSPSGYNTSNSSDDILKYAVDNIQKTPVKIIGIGLEDNNVKHFYKNYIVLDKVEELEYKLLEVLRKSVLNN